MRQDAHRFEPDGGNTPLDDDESAGLIPSHIFTRAELNQWEAVNIVAAQEWVAKRTPNVLDADVLAELHRRMFGETWEWAGNYRKSDKNVSPYHWTEVPRLMRDLIDNTRVQFTNSGKSSDELDKLAVRFHHGMVHIHPWPNGNGRHARFATDLLLRLSGRLPFTWGAADLTAQGDVRARYIKALQEADRGNFGALELFVRS